MNKNDTLKSHLWPLMPAFSASEQGKMRSWRWKKGMRTLKIQHRTAECLTLWFIHVLFFFDFFRGYTIFWNPNRHFFFWNSHSAPKTLRRVESTRKVKIITLRKFFRNWQLIPLLFVLRRDLSFEPSFSVLHAFLPFDLASAVWQQILHFEG